NPNSDLEMTEAIQKTAENFAKDFDVETVSTQGAPRFIETYEDQVKAAPGMIKLVRENEKEYDGFIIACHCDPNLDTIKEITKKPVVGIGEASMKMASMIGHSFSVISMTSQSIPNKEALIKKYNLFGYLASVRAAEEGKVYTNDEEKFFEVGKKAIEEDFAEVLVLGCAGMTGMDKKLEKRLGVPVLDGVICALIILKGLIEYGVSISKIRRYHSS
ncbi:MAG: aspartate/glutamate racemase family protein, partial [Candidatus Heimdallarchaeaceae archaeon]